MYPDEFDYYRAESIEHVFDLIDEHPDAEMLAGGHSLLPTMKSGLADPDVIIDIGDIEAMQGIEYDGDTASIGALTNYATVTNTDELWDGATVLAEAAGEIGDKQVRNRGTIGGNLAHSDPASDLPAAAITADATLVAQDRDGERRIDADDYFLGMYMTDLTEDELLTRIEISCTNSNVAGAYVKKPSPSSGYALVGVAARLHVDGGDVSAARVAANGVMDHGVRLDPVEDALEGQSLTGDTIESAAARAAADLDQSIMMDDLQASAEFRAQLLEVYTERALERAADRAGATITP